MAKRPEPVAVPAATPGAKIAERRLEVERQWCIGRTPRAIERDCAKQFECSKRTIRVDLAIARKRLAAGFKDTDPDAVRARAETMMLEAFEVAKGAKRAGDMVLAAQRVAEVHGAFERKVAVSVNGLAALFATGFDELPPEGTQADDEPDAGAGRQDPRPVP